MDDRIELIKKLKELALEISKDYEANIEIVISVNPVEESVKCKLTEFNL